ncbi:hypothetical protein NFI96_002046 [Prochilodus magdalenae]|nr:hypothetical protein NFI96_002046 [Prochilodus magdalenae]
MAEHHCSHPHYCLESKRVCCKLWQRRDEEMVVDFRRGRHAHLPLHVGGSAVEVVFNYRYLGVHLSNNLTWSNNTSSLVRKAHQRLYFLRRLRRAGLGSSVLTSLYRCVVESVLCSSISVWHGSCSAADGKALQRVVKAAQRSVGVSLPTTTDIYTTRCRKRATCIRKDPTHPAHSLFVPPPSGRRLRSIKCKTNRRRNSFIPGALQVVLVAPEDYLINRLSVGRLILVETNDCGIICKLQDFDGGVHGGGLGPSLVLEKIFSNLTTALCQTTYKANHWLNGEVRSLLKARDAAFRSGDAQELRRARRELTAGVKRAKAAYALKIQGHFSSQDPRSMWRGIKCITDYKTRDAQCSKDPSLPEALNKFYARFEDPDTPPSIRLTPTPGEVPLSVTPAEVRRTLRRINPRKSAGPDNIPGRVLRECADQISEVLADIFNVSLTQAAVPTCLKTATIIPVPKSSTVTGLNDYRPIALTPIVTKCFERLVMTHIKATIDVTVDPHQYAYRRKPFHR